MDDTEYLIDGYNFLMRRRGGRVPEGPGNLERARASLLGWLARYGAPRSTTVVFDAKQKVVGLGPHQLVAGIEVLFAVDYPDADALIRDRVEQHRDPTRLVVVSDDWEVRVSAERRRARAVRCEEFAASLTQAREARSLHKRNEPAPPAASEKPEPTADEVALWTQAFGSLDDEPAPDAIELPRLPSGPKSPEPPPAPAPRPPTGKPVPRQRPGKSPKQRADRKPPLRKDLPSLADLQDFLDEMRSAFESEDLEG